MIEEGFRQPSWYALSVIVGIAVKLLAVAAFWVEFGEDLPPPGISSDPVAKTDILSAVEINNNDMMTAEAVAAIVKLDRRSLRIIVFAAPRKE